MIDREYGFATGRMAELEARAVAASRAHRIVAARRAARRAERAAQRAARRAAAIF